MTVAFFKSLSKGIDKCSSSPKNTRRFVPVLKGVLLEYEKELPGGFVKFLKLGVIEGWDSDNRKAYIKTQAYRKWHFYFIDSLWGARCANCNNALSRLPAFSKPPTIYCSGTCAQNSPKVLKTREKHSLEKHGVAHPSQSKQFKEKYEKTMNVRHGGFTLSSPALRAKVDATNLERYGTKYLLQNKSLLKKSMDTQVLRFGGFGMASSVLRKKASDTHKKSTGYSHQFKNPEVRQKSKDTLLKHYGVDSPMRSKEIVAKVLRTHETKYGKHYSKLRSSKEKAKAIFQERYGVDAPMQNPESREKQQRAAFKIKKYKIKGKAFELQSKAEYHVAVKLVDQFGITDVCSQFHADFPDYVYSECGTFPDLYIGSIDTFIEVKSPWTLLGNKGGTSGNLKANRAKARLANDTNTVRWVVLVKNRQIMLPKGWYDTMTTKEIKHLCYPRDQT